MVTSTTKPQPTQIVQQIPAEIELIARGTSPERKAILDNALTKARELTQLCTTNNIGNFEIYGGTIDGKLTVRLTFVRLRKEQE
jgi:hypothetical protein